METDKNLIFAYDSGYEIGVIIGTYLPFIILSIIAYLIYNSFKNINNEQN
jgi:hypothetical protein